MAVVHLVRQGNGEAPVRRFLDSYRAHDPGAEHELVLLFKGFSSVVELERYRRLAADVCSSWVSVSDQGYDLAAYLEAARLLAHRRLCFLNSFSEVLCSNWLGWLVDALADPGTGLAGATGSWASQRSHLRYDLGLGGPYAGLLGDRGCTRELFRTLVEDETTPARARLARKLRTALEIPRRVRGFEPFPAHHVRTNGFLVERRVLVGLRGVRQRNKLDAYLLESGRRSLTRRVEELGLRAVVVGRDGRFYAHREWAQSHTFWQSEQENRLIDDNQTRAYASAGPELRQALARFAWGAQAQPGAGAPVAASGREPPPTRSGSPP
jgi:hypothetical protein